MKGLGRAGGSGVIIDHQLERDQEVEKRDRGTYWRGAARHTAMRQARTRRIAVVFIVGFFCFVIEVVLLERGLPPSHVPRTLFGACLPKGRKRLLKTHLDCGHPH